VASIQDGWLTLTTPGGSVTKVVTVPMTVPAWVLADVSGDGTRFLFTHDDGPAGAAVTVYDSTARTWRGFAAPATSSRRLANVKFTRPSGAAVWLTRLDRGTGVSSIERRSITGALQLSLPKADAILPSPDGTTFAVNVGRSISVRSNATGAVLRTLQAPSGRVCMLGHNDDPTSFTTACYDPDGQRIDAYRYSWSSGGPIAMTKATAPFGYTDVWRATPGIVASVAIQGTTADIGYAPRPGVFTPIKTDLPNYFDSAIRDILGNYVYVLGRGDRQGEGLRPGEP